MIEFLAYKTVPSTKRGCKGQFETRVEQAVRTCKNVKNRQTKSKDGAMDAVLQTIKDENLLEHKILAIRLDPKYAADKNLTGLIANGLLDTFCRPILILNKVEEDGKTYWRGSGRGYDKANLGSLRDLLEQSGLVDYAQGHAMAFGVSIPEENYEKLANAIIIQAVRDYRNSCQMRCSIERFFRSEWFMVLTKIDGEMLIKRLQEERLVRHE